MFKVGYTLFYLILLSSIAFSQNVNYEGPDTGSVAGGAAVSTDNFFKTMPVGEPIERGIRNTVKPVYPPSLSTLIPAAAPEGANYFEDPNAAVSLKKPADSGILELHSFAGIAMTNAIPPDPHIAVGPNHILATVNSVFTIWDKQGNLIKSITANQWYAGVLTSPGAFDPQIIYDHYAGRWFMLWDSQVQNPPRAHLLISVSDDDDPTGTWYNYALPANVMGRDTVDSWSDYPQIGFDQQAIYINTRQFTFDNNSKTYDRIRILNKAELYAAEGGPVYWTDLYDITYPGVNINPDVIHPVISYSSSSEYYFIHTLRIPSPSANFIVLYRLTNPLTNPVLTGVNIPVTAYRTAPDAGQLGGGTPLISVNESGMKTAPVYRDGFIWFVHSVKNPVTADTSTSLRYYKINVAGNSIAEEVTFGAPETWYLFPHLSVDKFHNIAINYTRSSLTEYPGAYYTARLSTDPPGLSGSTLIKEGAGNYVVTFGSDRNRWGDYQGNYLDPVTETNIWMFTEYAAATNTWGTWVNEIRLAPYEGAHIFTDDVELNFGQVEQGVISGTLSAVITNLGTESLIISGIPTSVGQFQLASNFIYPLTINPMDSLTIEFTFTPASEGLFQEQFIVSSNDPEFDGFSLTGTGFRINPAAMDVLYASTGGTNSNLLTLNLSSGSGTAVGPSSVNDIKSISVHPDNREIYGIITSPVSTNLLRINAAAGDAHIYRTLPLTNMTGIAFDTSGVLYGILRSGEIYRVNLSAGTVELISDAGINISGTAFNPLTNELWASVFAVLGSARDRIYKIDLQSGDTTFVGNTGFSIIANDIEFDSEGNLYGITGAESAFNNLVVIDTATAAGTIVGSTGFQNVTGLAYIPSYLTSVKGISESEIPSDFILRQNYPNPFNPVTKIQFALPVPSDVKLIVYNLLGEEVAILLDRNVSAGYHEVEWNSSDHGGRRVSSGIYFYELNASGRNGTRFSQFKKMILLK